MKGVKKPTGSKKAAFAAFKKYLISVR